MTRPGNGDGTTTLAHVVLNDYEDRDGSDPRHVSVERRYKGNETEGIELIINDEANVFMVRLPITPKKMADLGAQLVRAAVGLMFG